MPCLEPGEIVQLWSGDRDGAPEPTAAKLHLEGCATCQQLAAAMRRLQRQLPGALAAIGTNVAADCPPTSDLVALAIGRLEAGAATTLRAHAADCRRCVATLGEIGAAFDQAPIETDELLLKQALGAARRRGTTAVVPTAASPRWTWTAAALLAASLAGVALLGPVAIHAPAPVALTPAGDGFRQSLATPAPLPELLAPTEGERVAREGLALRWQATEGARDYLATVLDRRGEILWQGSSETTQLELPPGLVLEPGERYFAWVTARLEDGSSLRSSAVAFSVRLP